MCTACPGCALSNPTRSQSSELLYNFPIEAPMKVIHIDGYAAGKQQGFEGSELYLVACCGMCTFAAVEPISNASAKTFASAIMKIMLRYGLSHTVVLDKDSKFLGVCRESLDLLHINCHILSGGNHNPMLVERVNRYLSSIHNVVTLGHTTSAILSLPAELPVRIQNGASSTNSCTPLQVPGVLLPLFLAHPTNSSMFITQHAKTRSTPPTYHYTQLNSSHSSHSTAPTPVTGNCTSPSVSHHSRRPD